MSQFIDFTLPSTVPGRTLHGFRCVPEGQVRAVLQLSHGMVEYIDRYRPLAEYLADRGILVTGHDHLGHGASIRLFCRAGRQPRRTGRPARRNRADQGAVPESALLFAGTQHGLFLRPAVSVRVWQGTERCHHHGHRLPAQGTGQGCQDPLPGAGSLPRLALPQQPCGQPFLYGLQQGAGGPYHPRLAQPRSG